MRWFAGVVTGEQESSRARVRRNVEEVTNTSTDRYKPRRRQSLSGTEKQAGARSEQRVFDVRR